MGSMTEGLIDRARVLVVDDEPQARELLTELLQDEAFSVRTANDGHEAVLMAAADPPDLILMDCDMPKLDGFEACRFIKHHERTRLVPVIMVTGLGDREHRLRGKAAGCDDFLAKPIDSDELMTRTRAILRAKTWVDQLEQPEAVLVSLSTALDAKDVFTRGHSERVAELVRRLAALVGLPVAAQRDVWRAGLVHDIGKIGVPDELLRRPGALTAEETSLLRRHAEIGYDICKPLTSIQPLLGLIRGHHERLDGSGYPDRLCGDQISPALHCLIVADYFDALTSSRPYRPPLSNDQALGVLHLEVTLGRLAADTVEALASLPLRQQTNGVLSSAR